MSARVSALTIGVAIFLMASLSALHTRMFGIGLGYDVDCGQYIIGAITFALALIVRLPSNKLHSLSVICVLPILCALSFSWAELLGELGPQSSAGWGIVWFIYSYITSIGALVPALLIRWLMAKNRLAVCI